MRSVWAVFGLLAWVGGGLIVPPPVRAHEAASLEEEFVKGVFSPAFTPPAAGSYELPAVKRVPGVILKDLTGRSASTRQVTAGKVAVVSFIYTACPERLGCPLASLALQDLQAKLKEEGLGRHAMLLSISFDPERDTPAQLAKYARIYGADPKLWRFMTASSERVLDHALEGYGQDRAPVGQPEAEGNAGKADGGHTGDRFSQEEGAEPGGGDGAEGEKDRDLGRGSVAEGPQPEVVAHAAAQADEDDGEPAARREAGRGSEEALPGRQDGEKAYRGEHGEGADGQRRVLAEIGSVEDAADGPAQGAREDGQLSHPLLRAPALQGFLPEGDADSRDGQEHAEDLRQGQPLVAEGGRQHHGQEGKGREDQRGPGRGDEAQAVVQ